MRILFFVIALAARQVHALDSVVFKPGAAECSGGQISQHVLYKGEQVWTFNGTSLTEVECNATMAQQITHSEEFTIQSVFFVREFAFQYPNFSPFDDGENTLKEEQTPFSTYIAVRNGVRMSCSPPVENYIKVSNKWFITRTSCRTVNAGLQLSCTHWINGQEVCTKTITLPDPPPSLDASPRVLIGSDRTGRDEFMVGEIHSVSFMAEYDDSPFNSTETRVPTPAPTVPTASPTPRATLRNVATEKPTSAPAPAASAGQDQSTAIIIPCIAGLGGALLGLAFARKMKKDNGIDGEVGSDTKNSGSQGFSGPPSLSIAHTSSASGESSPSFVFHSKLSLFPQFRPVSHVVHHQRTNLSNEV